MTTIEFGPAKVSIINPFLAVDTQVFSIHIGAVNPKRIINIIQYITFYQPPKIQETHF